jgi:phage tail-like protein
MPRRNQDPVGNFRFSLQVDQIVAAGFAECTGLQMETKVLEYKEGGRNETTLKFPEGTGFGSITLKRGVTSSNELLQWQLDVASGKIERSGASARKVSIVLNDEKGVKVRSWNLTRPFPTKWVGPDLKAMSNEIAIESLEIAHEGIELK